MVCSVQVRVEHTVPALSTYDTKVPRKQVHPVKVRTEDPWSNCKSRVKKKSNYHDQDPAHEKGERAEADEL